MSYGVKAQGSLEIDFWSDTQAAVTITNAAQDLSLPDVVVSLPSESSILRVVTLIKARAVEDTSAVLNSLSGAQNLRAKLSTGVWGVNDIAAINLVDGQFTVVASAKEAGDVVVGDIDISSVVSGDGTYNFRLEDAIAVGSNLVLHDVLIGVRIYMQMTPELGLDPTAVTNIDILLARLTAARALLLDELTALRMAELDAANMPADIDTLLARLTADRAGYLDELAAANLPTDIDALLADLGDASASTLGSIYSILGNPAQTFLAMIGYEGATALADKLTAARAALLDEITAARLEELDAANLPADID